MVGPSSPAPGALHQQEAWLTAGNVAVDLDGFRVLVGGALVDLTYQEFELLRTFVSEPNHIILYDTLARAIWGSIGQRTRKRLGVLLCRLRAKLAASHPFKTIRGRGYGLVAPLGSGAASG